MQNQITTNEYELTVLFHPDLENNIEAAVEKVKNIITANNGEIIKEENDGKKRLAYSINGNEYAIYYFFELNLPQGAPANISSVLNITDEVLRYLLVREDNRKRNH